jgi:predicted  nucleic acid-binding Zn-ribbon protein
MRKLTKAKIAEMVQVEGRYAEAGTELNEQIVRYNEVVEAAKNAVENALEKFNEVRTELADIRDELVSEMDEYIDDKSEKWQEGESGQNYVAWKAEFEGIELDEITIDGLDADAIEEVNFEEQPLTVIDDSPAS